MFEKYSLHKNIFINWNAAFECNFDNYTSLIWIILRPKIKSNGGFIQCINHPINGQFKFIESLNGLVVWI